MTNEQSVELVYKWTRFGVIVSSAIGLCLNLLIIAIILKHRKMRTVTNVYVLNLAIFDSLNSLVLFGHHNSHVYTSKLLCGLYLKVYTTAFFGQGFQVALLSADRCVSVCYPMSAKRYRGMRYALWTSLAVWLVSVAISAPFVMNVVIGQFSSSKLTGLCTYQMNPIVDKVISCFFGFFLPILVNSIAYVMILSKVKEMRFQDKHSMKIRKVTIFVVVIISVHVLLWLPYWVVDFYNIIAVKDINNGLAEHIGYLHCVVNPIIYAVVNEKFRKYMLRYLSCKPLFTKFDKEETIESTNTPTQELNQM